MMKKLMVVLLAGVLPFLGFAKAKYVPFIYGDIELEPEDTVMFSLDDGPEDIDGYEVMGEYLPAGIEVMWTGKKFKCPKKGSVKYSKKEEDFYTTNDENPCGFSVSINKKTGRVSGSFKVYVMKSEKKVKSYTAKVSGYLGDELSVTIKKAGVYGATLD